MPICRLHALLLVELLFRVSRKDKGVATVRTRTRRSHNRRDTHENVDNEGDDMPYELLMAFEAIRGYQTRGYPIDLELRGARHAQPGRRRLFRALRTLAARLLRKGEKR
jgi:hypothetical protein